MYPNREPVLEVAMRGALVHDPRTNAVAYSDNAALVIRDFLRSDDGFGRADFVDESYFVTAANDCDDTITAADGAPEPRYRISGGYSLEEERGTVLKRLQVACAADMFLTPAGKIGIQVGKWQAPTVTLTDDMLIEVSDYGDGTDTIDRYNTLSYKFVDRGQDYAELGGVYVDAARKAEHGGKYEQELNYSYVPSNTQCTRLAKIQIEKDNPSIKAKIVCKPMALIALYETVIRWKSDIVGVDSTFRIVNYGLDTATGRVTYTLESINESAFDVIAEELHQAPLHPQLTPNGAIPIASGFAAFAKGVRGNSLEPSAGIFTSWSAVTPAGVYLPVLEIKQQSVGSWRKYQLSEGSTSYHITGLIEYEDYNVRLAFQSPSGNVGNYVLLENVEASCAPDTTVPILQVQNVQASQGLYRCLLTWAAVSAQDFKNYSIWRSVSDDFSTKTKIAETTGLDYADEDLVQQAEDATELFYWVTANYYCRNDVGPASATVSATPRKITADDILEGAIDNSHLSPDLQLEVEHFGDALTEKVSQIAQNAAAIDIQAIDITGINEDIETQSIQIADAQADQAQTTVSVQSIAAYDQVSELREQLEWLTAEAIRAGINSQSAVDRLKKQLYSKVGSSEAKYNQLIQTVADLDAGGFVIQLSELETKVDANYANLDQRTTAATTLAESAAQASTEIVTEFQNHKGFAETSISALVSAQEAFASESSSLSLELENFAQSTDDHVAQLAAEGVRAAAEAIAQKSRTLHANMLNGSITHQEINKARIESGAAVAAVNEQLTLVVNDNKALSDKIEEYNAAFLSSNSGLAYQLQLMGDALEATASEVSELTTSHAALTATVTDSVAALTNADAAQVAQTSALEINLNNSENDSNEAAAALAAQGIEQLANAMSERSRALSGSLEQGRITAIEIDKAQVQFGLSIAEQQRRTDLVATATEALSQTVQTNRAAFDDNVASNVATFKAFTDADTAQALAHQALLTEYGQNKSSVDQRIQAGTNAHNSLAGTVNTVSASVAVAHTDIDELEQVVDDIDADVAANQQAQTLVNSSVEQSLQTNASATEAVAQSVTDLETEYGANKTTVTNTLATHTSEIESHGQLINKISADYTTLNNTVGQNQQDQAELNANYQLQIDAQASAQGALSQKVDTVEATANSASTQVQTTSQAVADLEGNLSASWMISAGVGTNATTLVLSNAVSSDGSVTKKIAMRGDVLVDGTVAASALKAAEVEALVGTFNYVKAAQVDAQIGSFSAGTGSSGVRIDGPNERVEVIAGNDWVVRLGKLS